MMLCYVVIIKTLLDWTADVVFLTSTDVHMYVCMKMVHTVTSCISVYFHAWI